MRPILHPRTQVKLRRLRRQFTSRFRGSGDGPSLIDGLRKRYVKKSSPVFVITKIQPPALLVLMSRTTISQYEDASQMGRLSLALGRHARFFKSVMILTADALDYTPELGTPRVRHVVRPLPLPWSCRRP